MSRKRKNTSSPEPDDSPSPKRSHPSFSVEYLSEDEYTELEEKPQIHPYSGQTGAFPGLGEDDGAMFYGPASNGIDYLRMVRSEARGVPSLLVGAKAIDKDEPDSHNTGRGGYYADGAFTASMNIEYSTQNDEMSISQQEYYKTLLIQFRLLRATLKCVPPLSEIEKLSSSHPISFPSGSKIARDQWEQQLLSSDPHPVQIACMDFESIMELIRFMKRKLMMLLKSNNDEIRKRLGSWTWSILGRCRDRGELGSEDIGELRALAQKATNMLNTTVTTRRDSDQIQDEMDDAEEIQSSMDILPSDSNERSDVTDAREAGSNESKVKVQLNMILDMIVTIIGEMYGQRDLLELRPRWEHIENL